MRKKRKKPNKKEAQQKHFERRSLERVGVILNQKEIVRQIQTGGLAFVERQSNRITLYRLEHSGKAYKVVYDKLRKQVVTIMEAENETG